MRVDFYHLTATPVERALPPICARLLSARERLLIVAAGDLLVQLDRHLWSFAPEAFVPHGLASGAAAAEQPVLLSETAEALNGAANIAIADGLWRDAALGFARTFYFFDAAGLAGARTAWKALGDRADCERRYWKQEERGKWVEGP